MFFIHFFISATCSKSIALQHVIRDAQANYTTSHDQESVTWHLAQNMKLKMQNIKMIATCQVDIVRIITCEALQVYYIAITNNIFNRCCILHYARLIVIVTKISPGTMPTPLHNTFIDVVDVLQTTRANTSTKKMTTNDAIDC